MADFDPSNPADIWERARGYGYASAVSQVVDYVQAFKQTNGVSPGPALIARQMGMPELTADASAQNDSREES